MKGYISMEEKIVSILNEMAEYLSVSQMKKLQEVILRNLNESDMKKKQVSNEEYLRMFLAAKRIEGCSHRTLVYYRATVETMLQTVDSPIRKITTDDMRVYLAEYQKRNDCSKVTVDNIRRNISSFFSWLEEENYILKSPMRRIHKIKTNQQIKEVISDEDIERLRDHCTCKRDLAMIDLLYSTGIRVGELVNLNISDVDFEARECVVFGKGGKERRVYFDAKAKLHLQVYLESRDDHNPALFVTLDAPSNRLKISGVEIRIRELGRRINLKKIHPHKFRRTMATRAIDKGMPIEQVQKILGHSQIDTTMQYAMVNQSNVRSSHRKYIS
ncbi:integrase/recombinase XerD [Lachnospiraceae bacterium XBB1006]|nr:integrase/recombinase XerD [Lachnospiraceae bacterium XBB1006]